MPHRPSFDRASFDRPGLAPRRATVLILAMALAGMSSGATAQLSAAQLKALKQPLGTKIHIIPTPTSSHCWVTNRSYCAVPAGPIHSACACGHRSGSRE